ncbi:MAG: peptide chain release factor N(5)-glutamine methyltransferase [Phycisphaerales bacterium]|nr:peptide chain release factor N(5)-glutamine methyltransferase [Phycisphaerales bacterium]
MPAVPRHDAPWTTRRLLAWTTDYFTRKSIDSPRLSAEMLLAHVLGVARLKLYMDPDRPASEKERNAFRELVERALRHEPVDYLVGQAPFMSMMFAVTPAVLVPRPSTETLVEHIIQHARRTPGFANPLIADIGTGSGCIAISLAKHIPQARIIATDISPAALDIARQNAQTHAVADRIEFRQGDLLAPLVGEKLRYLVSNPPYIPDSEWEDVEPNVKNYEPTSALRGGADGLQYIRPLIALAHQHLDHPAQLLIEVAAVHKTIVLELARSAPGLTNPRILADHQSLPRVLVADAV